MPAAPVAVPPDRESIGLIGLGLMGGAMAERFLARGFEVVGFDIDSARLAAFVSQGGRAAEAIAELAVSCQRIILSLPNSDAVQTVLEQLEPHLHPGQLIVDTTTGCPEIAVAAGRRLAGHRVDYVEGTISGNSSQVRRGEVLVIASGAAQAIARCDDLFACFANKVHHVGDWGSASKLKLVSNLVLGLNRAVLAEGLAFAGKLGLSPEQTLAVLRDSMGYSRVMDTKGAKMIAGDFEPQARLSQHLKDVRLILSAAAASHAWTPLSEVHKQLLEQAESKGLGALDNSAIIRVLERED
ncbi:3-hydroxyisobutyrate dehydrogenase [Verrucomicrobiota bacterium]|nr:3-hydroxyisobutyrate dehydrogenase [Verrucomicrobiota bacterium]